MKNGKHQINAGLLYVDLGGSVSVADRLARENEDQEAFLRRSVAGVLQESQLTVICGRFHRRAEEYREVGTLIRQALTIIENS